MEAILLVWGVRDEVLKGLPVEGHWLYGEYDFIAKVEFRSSMEMEKFEKTLRHVIDGGRFKLMPVKISGVKGENGENETSILESIEVVAVP
ncbi:hypothetical protein [Thermococcus sp.]|uniref:hypothetical protein n=1 Tax=Thermococcus sp. TaxID=35749 RepID=UPI00260D9B2C|nr:hypothetical protein [Thermococcus sp.]